MKATAGVKLSFRLQQLIYLAKPKKPDEEEETFRYIPGFVTPPTSLCPNANENKTEPGEFSGTDLAILNSVAMNNTVYQLVRGNRQHRRNLLGNLLNNFNDTLCTSENFCRTQNLQNSDHGVTSESTQADKQSGQIDDTALDFAAEVHYYLVQISSNKDRVLHLFLYS